MGTFFTREFIKWNKILYIRQWNRRERFFEEEKPIIGHGEERGPTRKEPDLGPKNKQPENIRLWRR